MRTFTMVALIAFAIGCSIAQDNGTSFVGNWNGPARLERIQFFADGKFIKNSAGSTIAGTYKVFKENQKQYLNLDFKIITQMYEIVSVSDSLIKLKDGGTPRQLRLISKK